MPLSKGHVIVVPKRHVADFFDMSGAEQGSVLALLTGRKSSSHEEHKPDGYNIGVNIGAAAGQSRMHVHVHLDPALRRRPPRRKRGQSNFHVTITSDSRSGARRRSARPR